MDGIKLPEECASITDIRGEIDRIDRSIVGLLGRRRQYVMAAAKFKSDSDEVAAPERFAAMLQVRRRWAEQEGLDPDLVEKLYRELVGHFIAEERARWEKLTPET